MAIGIAVFAFPRAFPHFGTDHYWESQLVDLSEQLMLLDQGEEQVVPGYGY